MFAFCRAQSDFFNICLSRNSPEFQKLLGIAMELFLLCSEDAESDVRMVADECLNKVIKVRTSRYCVNMFNFLMQCYL